MAHIGHRSGGRGGGLQREQRAAFVASILLALAAAAGCEPNTAEWIVLKLDLSAPPLSAPPLAPVPPSASMQVAIYTAGSDAAGGGPATTKEIASSDTSLGIRVPRGTVSVLVVVDIDVSSSWPSCGSLHGSSTVSLANNDGQAHVALSCRPAAAADGGTDDHQDAGAGDSRNGADGRKADSGHAGTTHSDSGGAETGPGSRGYADAAGSNMQAGDATHADAGHADDGAREDGSAVDSASCLTPPALDAGPAEIIDGHAMMDTASAVSCTDFCEAFVAHCQSASLPQAMTMTICLPYCGAYGNVPGGSVTDTSGNTLGCRIHALTQAQPAPCQDVVFGATGPAAVCTAR